MEKIKLFLKPTIIKIALTIILAGLGATNGMFRDQCSAGLVNNEFCEKFSVVFRLFWPFRSGGINTVLDIVYWYLIVCILFFIIKLIINKLRKKNDNLKINS